MTSEGDSEKRKALASFIQDAIDKGATTVEEIHKSIADLPLKMLEESKLLRGSAKEVRRVQDHTIVAIYDVIRGINQEVGTLASEVLAEAAKVRREKEELGGVERAPLLHWGSWQVGVDVDAGQETLFGFRNPDGIP